MQAKFIGGPANGGQQVIQQANQQMDVRVEGEHPQFARYIRSNHSHKAHGLASCEDIWWYTYHPDSCEEVQ